MNNVQRLASSIRNYVNTHNLYDKCYKDNKNEWNKLCVSMDTIEDNCEALLCYEKVGIGGSFGEKYLRLYGILQAIVLKQDAVKGMCESLKLFCPKLQNQCEKLEQSLSKSSETNWKTIRELRNLTVGHPIEMKRSNSVKRCFITRVSISSRGFELIVYNATENKDEFENIDFQKLYSGYKKETTTVLNEILNNLISLT